MEVDGLDEDTQYEHACTYCARATDCLVHSCSLASLQSHWIPAHSSHVLEVALANPTMEPSRVSVLRTEPATAARCV